MDQVKRCTACGEWKALTEFHADRGQPDGRMYQCKTCRKILRRESYQRNAEKQIDRNREYRHRVVYADPFTHREYLWRKKFNRSIKP